MINSEDFPIKGVIESLSFTDAVFPTSSELMGSMRKAVNESNALASMFLRSGFGTSGVSAYNDLFEEADERIEDDADLPGIDGRPHNKASLR